MEVDEALRVALKVHLHDLPSRELDEHGPELLLLVEDLVIRDLVVPPDLQLIDVEPDLLVDIEPEWGTQLQEELQQHRVVDLHAVVLACQRAPDYLEIPLVHLEVGDVVLLAVDVPVRELVQNYQDEQVHHHPDHHYNEEDPEDQRLHLAAVLVVAVPHREVPVLARRPLDQREQGQVQIVEVVVLVDLEAGEDRPEEVAAHHRKDEVEQEEQCKDDEHAAQGVLDSVQELVDALRLSNHFKDPRNSKDSKDPRHK